ncbi:DUF6572 domain-containing protein [Neolewinella maritima]|uniref:DUF6572 domain-containing protein n=1 Tax=Neolewinella maritima TaxID=1383882 RepID=UPI001EE82C9C|nr:DUF6572 domain-containing protein [Neolewinella maritima]
MSVSDASVIDMMGYDPSLDRVILTISNHLNWEDELVDLYHLQEKVNAYVSFYESGQIYKVEPRYMGKKIVIRIVSKFKPTALVERFYETTTRVLDTIGLSLDVTYLVID